MKKVKVIAFITMCILLLQNLFFPAVQSAQSLKPAAGEQSINTLEPGRETSLENLAAQGLISKDNYVQLGMMKAEAREYAAADQSFAKQMGAITAEYASYGDMLQSESGAQAVTSVLRNTDTVGSLIKTSEDFNTLVLLKHKTNQLLQSQEIANTAALAAVSEIKLYIDDIIIQEDLAVNPDMSAKIKGTWTEQDQVVLRWQHDEDWTPAYGYNLYRIVNNRAELLESHIGMDGKTDSKLAAYAQKNAPKLEVAATAGAELQDVQTELHSGLQTLLADAEVTQAKLDILGFQDRKAFQTFIAGDKTASGQLNIVKGEESFQAKKTANFLEDDAAPYDEEELSLNTVLAGREVNQKIEEQKMQDEMTISSGRQPLFGVGIQSTTQKLIDAEISKNSGLQTPQGLTPGLQQPEPQTPGVSIPGNDMNPNDITVPGNPVQKLEPVIQDFDPYQLDGQQKTSDAEMKTKEDQLKEILNSRNMIHAGCNVDLELADAVGLAYVDDVRNIRLEAGYAIYVLLPVKEDTESYALEALAEDALDYARTKGLLTEKNEKPDLGALNRPEAITKNLKQYNMAVVELGKALPLEAPEKIQCYALNNKASIRWSISEDQVQKNIISGYHVYRKRNLEPEFTKVNEAPIVVPYYTKSIEGIAMTFESPVFFEDTTVKNGDWVVYKVESIDIFGRTSGMSKADSNIAKVVKTIRPEPPVTDQAYLSTDVAGKNRQDWLIRAAELSEKGGRPGIILPVSTATAKSDAVLFNIYRSRAYGNETFSEPEKVASLEAIGKNITVDRFLDKNGKDVPENTVESWKNTRIPKASDQTGTTLLNQKIYSGELVQEFLPGTYYLDTDIQQGFYYQYWVASVDEWGNESAWSTPVTAGYAMKRYDARVQNVFGRIVENLKINAADYLPGLSENRVVSKEKETALQKLATGEVTLVLPDANKDLDLLTNNLKQNAVPVLPSGSFQTNQLPQTAESPENKPNMGIAPNSNLSLLPVSYQPILTGELQLQREVTLKDITVGNKVIQPKQYAISREKLKINGTNEVVVAAAKDNSTFGLSLTHSTVTDGAPIPEKVSTDYMNMPDIHQITSFVAYQTEDFNPDGSLNVSWYAYQGGNLKEYALYRGVVADKTIQQLNNMTKAEVAQHISECVLVGTLDANVTVDYPPAPPANALVVYIVVAVPENPTIVAGYGNVNEIKNDSAYGGWVKITWNAPADRRQVKHYRIDRASVESFQNLNMDALKWTLIENKCRYTYYFQPVEQISEQFYVYRITPVSIWNVEGAPAYTQVRVPCLLPPAEPEMLLPYSKPGQVDVRFTAVADATKYHIYRTEYNIPGQLEIQDLLGREAVKSLFSLEQITDSMQSGTKLISPDYSPLQAEDTQAVYTLEVEKKTVDDYANQNIPYNIPADAVNIIDTIHGMDSEDKKDFLREVINEYGVLAVQPYNKLSSALASTLEWEKVGTLYATSDMKPGDELVYEDASAEFGVGYYYTVAAANTDMESSKPEPVKGSCRLGDPFAPPKNVSVTTMLQNNNPQHPHWYTTIRWDHITLPNYSQQEAIDQFLVGYIVYRCSEINGEYYQVSEVIRENEYVDTSPYAYQNYFYRVRAVNIAGLISDFSSVTNQAPQAVQQQFVQRSLEQIQSLQNAQNNPPTLQQPSMNSNFPANVLLKTEFERTFDQQKALLGYAPNIIEPGENLNPFEIPSWLANANEDIKYAENIFNHIQAHHTYTIGDFLVEDIDTASLRMDDEYLIYGRGNIYFGETRIKLPVNFKMTDFQYAVGLPGVAEPFEILEGELQLNIVPFMDENTNTFFTNYHADIYNNRTVQGATPGQAHWVDDIRTKATVSGMVKNHNGKLLTDLNVLYLEHAPIMPNGIIKLRNMPVFHYGDYTIYGAEYTELNLNHMHKRYSGTFAAAENKYAFPITLYNGKAQTSFSYPTVDNQGLVFNFSKLGVIPLNNYCPNLRAEQKKSIVVRSGLVSNSDPNLEGELSGLYGSIGVQKTRPTTARFVVPAGIAVRMDEANTVFCGDITLTDKSRIKGEVLLPFFDAPEEFINGTLFAQKIDQEAVQSMSATIISLYNEGDDFDEINLDKMVFNIVDAVKNNGLMIMGGNAYGQSTIPFEFEKTNTDRGFILEHVAMEPTMVGNYNIYNAVQRIEQTALADTYTAELLTELVEQSMVVQSPDVSVDLTEYAKPSATPENKWYSDISWKGILLHEGSLTLSKDLFTSEGGKPIAFNLKPQEMIYDTNGFLYQKSVVTKPGEEIKIELGEDFGGFPEARLTGLMLDMYNNRFEFSMEGSVFIRALNNEEFGIRMYTEKGDQEDAGLVKASLIAKENVLLTKPAEFNHETVHRIVMDVYGGYFDKQGVHVNGAFDFHYPGAMKANGLEFNELILPAFPEELATTRASLSQGETLKKGTAYFSQPYSIKYNGFEVELTSFDLYSDLDRFTHSFTPSLQASNMKAGQYPQRMVQPLSDKLNYIVAELQKPGIGGNPPLVNNPPEVILPGPSLPGVGNIPSLGESIKLYQLDILLFGSASLAPNIARKPGSRNVQLYIEDINGSGSMRYDKSEVYVEIPNGEGVVSGKVEPSPVNPFSEAVGKESTSYEMLKTAQGFNKDALELCGNAQEIKNRFEELQTELNLLIAIVNDLENRVQNDAKPLVIQYLDMYKKQKALGKAKILQGAREIIDNANIIIAKYNTTITKLELFAEQYLESPDKDKPLDADFKGMKVDPLDKQAYIRYIEEMLDSVDGYIEENTEGVEDYIRNYEADYGAWGSNNIPTLDFDVDDYYIQDVLSTADEVLTTAQKHLDEAVEKYDQFNGYVDQVDKYYNETAYPGFTVSEDGIIEFKPKDDKFVMTLLEHVDFLEGTGVQINGRFGWQTEVDAPEVKVDTDLFFYSFAVGYIATPITAKEDDEGKKDPNKPVEKHGLKMGMMEIQNLVGVIGYNMILPYSETGGYSVGFGTQLLSSVDSFEIDRENNGEHFFIAAGDAYVNNNAASHRFALKNMRLIIETDGSFDVRGEFWGPNDLTKLTVRSANNSTRKYGGASASYNARKEDFKISVFLDGIPIMPGITVGGSLGFDWGKDYWMLYLGYPDYIRATIEALNVSAGFGLKAGTNPLSGNAVFAVKLQVDYSDHFDLGIVYADLGVYFKAEIGYQIWNMDEVHFSWYREGTVFEGFAGYVALGGHIAGGIDVGKYGKYEIISLSLDARADLVNPREDIAYVQNDGQWAALPSGEGDKGDWHLFASIKISYHLDLWIVEFSDSFYYDYKTKF